MSNRYKFYRSGLLLTAVALAMKTVSMFFGAYVTRAVGAEGVGLYTVVMTVYSFAVTFATSGISLTVTRLVAAAIGEGRPENIRRTLSGAIIYSLVFGLLATLFLFFGANFLGIRVLSDERTVISLKVLAFSLIPIALGSVFSGYFVGVKRVGFNATVQVFAQFIKIVLTVILVSSFSERGVRGAVAGLCLGITLTELIAFLLIYLEYVYDKYKYKMKKSKGAPDISSVSKMAIPLALSAYVRSVLLTVEHILIPKRLKDGGETSSEAYAHYGTLHGMALPIILYPLSPLSSFSGLLVPEFAEDMSAGNRERMNRVSSEAINTTLTYATISAVFLYVFSEELGYLIYKSYDAGYYVAILALVVPIMYLDHVTDAMLKGIGEHVYSMWVNISDSLLSVALVWLLIPKMGILGYAVVIVIMEGYNFALSIFRLAKRIKFKIAFFDSVLVPFAIASLSALVSNSIFRFGGSTAQAVWLILKMIFGICMFVGLLSLYKAFLPTDKIKAK